MPLPARRNGKTAAMAADPDNAADNNSTTAAPINFNAYLSNITDLVEVIKQKSVDGANTIINNFSGERNTESARDWMSAFERTAGRLNWSEATKLDAAPGYFVRGSTAYNWHQVIGESLITWTTWHDGFLAAFPEPTNADVLMAQMRRCVQQPSEAFTAYLFSKLELCLKCGIAPNSEEALAHAKSGMKNRNHAGIVQSVCTIDALVREVNSMEENDRPYYDTTIEAKRVRTMKQSAFASSEPVNWSSAIPSPSTNPFASNYPAPVQRHDPNPTQPLNAPVFSAQDVRFAPQDSAPVPKPTKATDPLLEMAKQMKQMAEAVAGLQLQVAQNQPQNAWVPQAPFRPSYQNRTAEITCNYCGKRGHTKRNCYKLTSKSAT